MPTRTALQAANLHVYPRPLHHTEKLASRCFDASRLSAVFLDDGFLPDKVLPWSSHERFVAVKRILRLEHLAETLIELEDGFDTFLDHFRSRIDPPPPE